MVFIAAVREDCSEMENSVKNHIDILIFHTAYLC